MMSPTRFPDLRDAVDYAFAEQLRGLAGPFISLIQREEHLKHLTGIPHNLGLLTTVFLGENGADSPGKHWNQTYTAEQRNAVATLPAVRATRDDITAFGLGLAHLLVNRARPLFKQFDLVWPSELAQIAAARVHEHLGIDATAWLY